MQKYIGKWYIYFGLVWKIEEKDWEYSPWQDNWFAWKVWKLIWYNYCRIIPKLQYKNKCLDIWWLIFNFTLTYYD